MKVVKLHRLHSNYGFLRRLYSHTILPTGQSHKVKQSHVQLAETNQEAWNTKRTRNIGIIAHIDAGKTTTTERLLYLAGATKALGDVDSGDTVTDYLAQERERGITITSAAVTFYWHHYRINLIDTPGHVDFTLEVERCLRVLDGAVTVLDASAGVEAQTLTVWKQAKRYEIPSVVFLNKMDKPTASLPKSLDSIRSKLRTPPLPLQMPLYSGKNGKFSGVLDLLTGEALEWPMDDNEIDGRTYKKRKLNASSEEFPAFCEARDNFLGTLAELDDSFGDILVERDSKAGFDPLNEILPAVRRVTLARKGVPVICGSSLKNKAVQPLLNLICDYLPNPAERDHQFAPYYKDHFCGLAFKISHHKKLGPLTYVRIYSGDLRPHMHAFNASRKISDLITHVFLPHSNELQETNCIKAGNIAVVSGLGSVYTGDTLVETEGVAKAAARQFAASHQSKDDSALLLAGIEPPDPVFFCSIEPPSAITAKKLDEALAQLCREDPSLSVRFDRQSHQTILQSQGELHLEIVKDRLKREWNLDVFLGPLRVNYKEFIKEPAEASHTVNDVQAGITHHVHLRLRVEPVEGQTQLRSLKFAETRGETSIANLRKDWKESVLRGCQNATQYGPLLGYPVMGCQVTVVEMEVGRKTSAAVISSCAMHCLSEAMRSGGAQLMEPMMRLEVRVESDQSERAVLSDLAKRKAQISEINTELDETGAIIEERIISALAPLAELQGLVSVLRSVTSGRSHLHMKLEGFQLLTDEEQKRVLETYSSF